MSAEEYHGKAVPQARGQIIASYWGYMPFTQSYEYIGVLVLLLALIGAYKYWKEPFIKSLVVFSIFLVFLSFGRHFVAFYELFFNYVPFFDKFRSPMMSVAVTFFIIVVLAGFGLAYLSTLYKTKDEIKKHKDLLYIIGGFFIFGVLVWLFFQGFTFVKAAGERYQGQSLELVKLIRKEMFNSDIIRYFIILLVSAGAIIAYLLKKINQTVFSGILIIIIAIDFINLQTRVNKKYIDPDKLESQYFHKISADNYLLSDSEIFRIFPAGNLFGDNRWAYYHQTIGGYTPIKMYTIEELVENNIYNGWDKELPFNWNVLKILNVKYLITQGKVDNNYLDLVNSDEDNKLNVYRFNEYLRRGFFVNDYVVVKNEFDRIKMINNPDFDPKKTAILEVDIFDEISKPDSSYSRVIDYNPNLTKYDVYTDKQALFVMSEVNYPPGWKLYIDGTQTGKIYKTDHAIQSAVIPEGRHTVELRFEPDSFNKDLKISYASISILYIMLVVSYLFENKNTLTSAIRKKNK